MAKKVTKTSNKTAKTSKKAKRPKGATQAIPGDVEPHHEAFLPQPVCASLYDEHGRLPDGVKTGVCKHKGEGR